MALSDAAHLARERYRDCVRTVKVRIVPEGEHVHDEDGNLPAETRFWVFTDGLRGHCDLPEIELRGVPALWTHFAAEMLNGLAAYTVDNPIAPGETLQPVDLGGRPIPAILRAEVSPDDFWETDPVTMALRLEVQSVPFQCEHCTPTPADARRFGVNLES